MKKNFLIGDEKWVLAPARNVGRISPLTKLARCAGTEKKKLAYSNFKLPLVRDNSMGKEES